MRVAPRAFDWIGSVAFVFALLLASPGVQVSHADAASLADEGGFSWDPALEPGAADAPPSVARSVRVSQPAGTCAAQSPAPIPSTQQMLRGLQGMPLLIADGDEGLSSLNGRGYNIGKAEPSAELQKLMAEIRRQGR